MKTIEERADEYVDMPCTGKCDECTMIEGTCRFYNDRVSFIAGAQSEHEELTKWHDPKEELPDTNRDVLIKTTLLAKYRIAFYKADGQRNYHWHQNNGAIDDDMVIGWREIHE